MRAALAGAALEEHERRPALYTSRPGGAADNHARPIGPSIPNCILDSKKVGRPEDRAWTARPSRWQPHGVSMTREELAERSACPTNTIPTTILVGYAVVHNNVRPTRRLGARGFRAWLWQPKAGGIEVCPCAWAPELGQHYRVTAAWRRREEEAV